MKDQLKFNARSGAQSVNEISPRERHVFLFTICKLRGLLHAVSELASSLVTPSHLFVFIMMIQSIASKQTCWSHLLQSRSSSASTLFRPLPRSWKSVKKASRHIDLALNHFDALYSKVYGRTWPSMRLGLLSPRKQCAILNTFLEDDEVERDFLLEGEVIDLARYYKKHQLSYTRWQLRKQIIDNKKARKREVLAKNADVPIESIDTESIEVSDVSDSELRGAETTDAEGEGGFSSAEDLVEMFSDRRMDDDEKFFINRASTQLSLNDFVPATELLRREDLGSDLIYYDGYDPNLKLNVEFQDEPSLEFNSQLKIYMFPRNSWSQFQNPTAKTKDGLMSHYLLDGASVLPVLALDLQFDDVCADYCAAPGGKSLAMLMTLRPKYLLCNDVSSARLGRTYTIMRQYAPEISYVKSTLRLSNRDITNFVQSDAFDKILIDVPCSNDRHSAESIDNNIFKRTRTEERLKLPQKQCDILKSALKSVRPKGSVVYSTCTLSPLENDSVVQRALMQLEEENHPSKFAVVNLKEAFRPLRGLYRFNTKFTYGQQVVPHISCNFGPMYISKIKRLS